MRQLDKADGVIFGKALVKLVARHGSEVVTPVQTCLREIDSSEICVIFHRVGGVAQVMEIEI